MKKICFFIGDITRSGGTERVSSMIANALSTEGNYTILFLSLTEQGDSPFFPLHHGIRHYTLGDQWMKPGPGYLKIIPRLRRFLKQHDIDIIIDIDIVLDVLSLPAAKGLGIRIISWEHFHFSYEMHSLYRRFILRYSVKRTDHIVTLTEGTRQDYMKNTGRSTAITTIHNPMQAIRPEETAKKENWLITVGHLIPVKGMDYLAEVAVQVLKRFPDWKWMVVGDGKEKAFLEDFIDKHGLQGQLILTGRTDDVNFYLQRAQIYVMTSRSEGFPMCLLEAKAFCLPSVCFDVITDSQSIIEDGVNGYLIAPFACNDMAEKLQLLMQDETLRRRFAEHARDHTEPFQMKTILEQWNRLLESL